MKIKDTYASQPVVSVKMDMEGSKFGYRVVIEYNGKTTSFFHEGNNQRAAEEAGRLLAMKIKYEK